MGLSHSNLIGHLKKLIVGIKWKSHLAARSRAELKSKLRRKSRRRQQAQSAFRRPRPSYGRDPIKLVCPEIFSVIHNPDQMAEFFEEMHEIAKIRSILVDLSNVKTMTPDAIACLLATIRHCSLRGAAVGGNVPISLEPQKMLDESGFRKYVKNVIGPRHQQLMGEVIRFSRSTGEAVQNKFDQKVARGLIEFAKKKLTGASQPHGPSYSVFCEAMLNTWNHAARNGRDREPWWASVYFDSSRNRACFTFLDVGLGIFRSHRLTARLKLFSGLGLLNTAELLQRLFRGEIPSSTREPGRGNGIPGMYSHCKEGRIQSLTVVSNSAYGNVQTDTYKVLSTSFGGTLLYWEI